MPLIRPARPDDRAAWEPLFRAYAEFYRIDLTPPMLDTVWTWAHDPSNPFWCAFAVDAEDRPVAFTHYQLMHRALGAGMVCYLSDLFTAPEARGTGAARALIDHVRAFARANGLASVRWLTAEDNATARRLYDSYAPRTPFILYSIPPT